MAIDYELLTQKKKDTPFSVKGASANQAEIDTTGRLVKLVANTFNYFDHDFDALTKTCANRSISNNGAKSEAADKICHLLHHDMKRVVGKSMNESVEKIDGKYVLAAESYLPETIEGEDTLTKYKLGMYNQHSIGFNYLDLTFMEKGAAGWDKWMSELINPEDADIVGYGWKVSEIKLWEYSTVTFGANKLTPYLGTKSLTTCDVIRKKIDLLAEKAIKREVVNRDLFDYELMQLQQMVVELYETVSLKQSTPPKDPQNESTLIELSGFSKLLKF